MHRGHVRNVRVHGWPPRAASSSSSSHLAEQDRGPVVGTRMYGHSPPSSCPRIPVSPVAGTWGSSPTPTAGTWVCWPWSLPWLHPGHAGPPARGLAPAAALGHPHVPRTESPSLWERCRKGFKKKGRRPERHADQPTLFTCDPPLFIPVSLYFPVLAPLPSPKPLPFPTLCSSPTHPVSPAPSSDWKA